jgi:hypothetical protein
MIRRYHLAAIEIFHRSFSPCETTGFAHPTKAEIPIIDVEDGPLVRRRRSRISLSSQDGSSSFQETGYDTADGDDRLSASAELHEPAVLLATPGVAL